MLIIGIRDKIAQKPFWPPISSIFQLLKTGTHAAQPGTPAFLKICMRSTELITYIIAMKNAKNTKKTAAPAMAAKSPDEELSESTDIPLSEYVDISADACAMCVNIFIVISL